MKYREKTAFAVLVLFFAAPCVTGQAAGSNHEPSAIIAKTILVGGHALDYDRDLSDKFGGRLTGSAAYARAAEWAADTFRSVGLKNVHFESFDMPFGWERGSVNAG